MSDERKTWEPEAIKRCAERLLISPENFSAQATMAVALGAHFESMCPAGKHVSITTALEGLLIDLESETHLNSHSKQSMDDARAALALAQKGGR